MTTNKNSKTNLIAKIISGILALILAACSLAPAKNTLTTQTQPSLVPNTPTYTATASQTPTVEPTATIEPTPTVQPTLSPEQALAEFKESAEYKQGLQDYLNAMGLPADAVTVRQVQKEINGEVYDFITITPDETKLTDLQRKYKEIFIPVTLFIYDKEADLWRLTLLRDADINDITVGTEGSGWLLSKSDSLKLAQEHVEIVIPTYPQINWKNLQPTQDKFDESKLRSIVKTWKEKGFKIILPSILSVRQTDLPDWFINGTYSDEEVNDFITNYVSQVIRISYEEGIESGIIVSEPFLPTHRTDDFFYSRFKDYSYIRTAVLAAKQTQPKFRLIANDTDNHSNNGLTTKLTKRILLENPEIDYAGIEAHLGDWVKFPSTNDTTNTLTGYNRPLIISEHDINLTGLYGDLIQRLFEQAKQGQIFLTATRKSGVNIFIFWGLDGQVSWLKNSLGQTESYATLFDEFGNPTPYFYIVIEILLNH
jgi:GH35 family endo-1,4-beta-xylanase